MKLTTATSLASLLLFGTACSGSRASEITRNTDTNRVERDARADDEPEEDAAESDPDVADAAYTDTGAAENDAGVDIGQDAAGVLDATSPDDEASVAPDARSELDAQVLDAAETGNDVPDAAEAPDGAEAGIDAGNGEAPDGSVCGTELSSAEGCADGLRRGLTSGVRHPDIAACAGSWTGDVSNASALCAAGFHVCTGAEPALRAVTYQLATCFAGCFAFDAAQDNYQCLPDCSSRIGSVDTAQRLDMAGMGSDCPYKFSNAGSCLMAGRIDASENDGIGCNYNERFRGVICCRDLTSF